MKTITTAEMLNMIFTKSELLDFACDFGAVWEHYKEGNWETLADEAWKKRNMFMEAYLKKIGE